MKNPKRSITVLVSLAAVAAVALLWLRSGKDSPKPAKKPQTKVVKITRMAAPARGLADDAPVETAASPDDDPKGRLRLEGQVIDAADAPVAGATVAISSNPPRTTKTGADGSFHFDALLGRRYRLVARADAGVAGPITSHLTNTSDPVVLKLRGAATIEVKVVSGLEEKPVSGATVELRGMLLESATSDAEGVAVFRSVPSGRYQIAAKAPGFALSYARVFLGQSSGLHRRKISMRKGAAVSGRVVSEDGTAVAGAVVAYAGAADRSQRADPKRDGRVTDAAGRFQFDALPSGSFRFSARHGDYAPATSPIIVLDGTSAATDVEIIVKEGGILSGVVLSKSGAAVPWATVRVGGVRGGGGFRGRGRRGGGVGGRQTTADEQGKFHMTGLPRARLSAVAAHDAGASEVAFVDLNKTRNADVELVLAVDGVIAGRVVDSKGEPVEGAQVRALPASGPDSRALRRELFTRGMPQELTDSGGAFKFQGLPVGEYRIEASRPGTMQSRRGRFGRRGADEDENEVVAVPGDTNVKVVLPANGGVKGKLQFADGTAPNAFIAGLGFRSRTPFSNKDGSFVLEPVAPGSHRLFVTGVDFEAMRLPAVEVKEGEIHDMGVVTVNKGRIVSGRVVSSSGQAIAGASVMAGRVVFGDGARASSGRFGGQQTTSGDDGAFSLRGLASGPVSVVADHTTLGRSAAVDVPGGSDGAHNLTLVIAEPGAVEGITIEDGKPVAGAIVVARSASNAVSLFRVRSGEDGAFRFDRLAADEYTIIAFSRRGMRRFPTAADGGKKVVVKAAETVKLELALTDLSQSAGAGGAVRRGPGGSGRAPADGSR